MKIILICISLLFTNIVHAAFWWTKIEVIDPYLSSVVPIKVAFDKKLQDVPSPTVVLAHGCNGINTEDYQWVSLLFKAGFNVVIPDSLGARNLPTTCNSNKLTFAQRGEDINAMAAWVKKQSWHRGAVVGIGFSHGAASVLEAGIIPNTKLDGVIAYYPKCNYSYHHVKVPSQIHIGSLDTWTPSSLCESFKDLNKLQQVFVYDGAYHSFDRSYNNARWGHVTQYSNNATEQATKTTLEFLSNYK